MDIVPANSSWYKHYNKWLAVGKLKNRNRVPGTFTRSHLEWASTGWNTRFPSSTLRSQTTRRPRWTMCVNVNYSLLIKYMVLSDTFLPDHSEFHAQIPAQDSHCEGRRQHERRLPAWRLRVHGNSVHGSDRVPERQGHSKIKHNPCAKAGTLRWKPPQE